jgi:ABC-type transporter MlaC component
MTAAAKQTSRQIARFFKAFRETLQQPYRHCDRFE